ncbi:NADase-type glycan-binding domain-containing protein [Cesiribacter andamanensis]|uniref:Hint domain-containing protein n=1 Tax=Cesiribacter andamanensis AMV16 TaxID=1279009 RepID=M7N3C6_9BACT|nr:hypothetical protein [Cesiribacter andamanensis]EMR01767.1 hypothetical protein ADICEAN_03087 [Cesiribacter andamanensis AMV16]
MRVPLLLFLLISSVSWAQPLPLWKPVLGYTPDLSPAAYKAFASWKQLATKARLNPSESLQLEEINGKYHFHQSKEDLESIVGAGCSWYCAGGPYAISASSELGPRATNTYYANNAHDLSLQGAWVEAAPGPGVGEWIEYRFSHDSPRLTEIKIFNGFTRSERAWQENGRVKRLKLYVNNTPTALLQLEDSRAEQRFTLPDIWGHMPEGEEMVLRFEIAEVYPGSKTDDTVITEIYFDGTEVHCFARGSLVSMADGSQKPIEQLAAGDQVLAYGSTAGEATAAAVEGVVSVTHCKLIRLTFEDGTEITATPDHPFVLAGGRWASYDPAKSRRYTGYESLFRRIQLGDLFRLADAKDVDRVSRLLKIEELHQAQPTYTITRLSGSARAYVVNGLLVGTEELPGDAPTARNVLTE